LDAISSEYAEYHLYNDDNVLPSTHILLLIKIYQCMIIPKTLALITRNKM